MNNFHQLFLLKKRIDRKSAPGHENDGGGKKRENDDEELPGYPHYSPNEDIYRQEEELKDLDPEDPSKKKQSGHVRNDLDVPGSELDDDLEDIGSEDEENNYWSIGGDDHENLEENRDEDQEGLNA
jgi:hypothetical protein